MTSDKEKKNRTYGMLISIGGHALLLLLFFFLLAWKEPDPPLPEYGIEVNFGLEDSGSGEVQPRTPPVESPTEEEAAPEEAVESQPEEVLEDPVDEAVDQVEEQVEEVQPPVKNIQESPEVIEEKPKETTPKPVEKEPVKEEKKPTPSKETTYQKPEPEKAGNKGQGEASTAEVKGQGDDVDKSGDKGDPRGEYNESTTYTGGGKGGAKLNIVGWMWDQEPNLKDQSSENGVVTFEFIIDEDGYVIGTKILKTSLSPNVARFYENQLKQTTFSRTGSGIARPGNTKGTVTFTVVSK